MANAYATIASGGWRNRPIAITKVTFPDGNVDNLGKPRQHRAFSDGVTDEATKILEQNVTSGTGRPNATASAARPPARPARPTTTPTRGSSATRRTCRPPSGSASRTNVARRRCRASPAARIPAKIWGQYMKQATRRLCGDFPQPKTPFKPQPFFGRYSGGRGQRGLEQRLRQRPERGRAPSDDRRRRRSRRRRRQRPAATAAGTAAAGGSPAPADRRRDCTPGDYESAPPAAGDPGGGGAGAPG